MADVTLRKVVKKYDEVEAVRGIDLDIADHEFVVLVGPSGCGKSTTLRMIAGLEDITDGDIMIGGDVVNDVPPKDRDIAMVFQNYALYPHMTVAENMSFGLRLKHYPKAEIKARVTEAARLLDITDLIDRKPKQLSGGQRQRVAMGRAIVRNPKVFLFDEPLSNLDAKLRVQMRIEITRLQRTLGVTTIYVTHDQTEAMTMADRIAVMKDGVLQQFDTPMETYHKPANLFVAGFIGSPAMNFITGSLSQGRVFTDEKKSFEIDLDAYLPKDINAGTWILGIRPEDIHGDNGLAIASYHPVEVMVEAMEPLGSDSFLYGKLSGKDLIARLRPENAVTLGQIRTLYVDRSRLHLFHP